MPWESQIRRVETIVTPFEPASQLMMQQHSVGPIQKSLSNPA